MRPVPVGSAVSTWAHALAALEARTLMLEAVVAARGALDGGDPVALPPLPPAPGVPPSPGEALALRALHARTEAAMAAAEGPQDPGLRRAALAYARS